MTIKFIVGLQNPGAAYAHTRHNAGGWFIDHLVKQHGGTFKSDQSLQAELARVTIHEMPCVVVRPATFMNHSGSPVRAITQFYRIDLQEVLVVHDELDLPVGSIKLKTGGGHGGHNGLRDIVSHLGGTGFHRMRIGIGHPGHKDLVLDYVLGKPSLQDYQSIVAAIERGVDVMPTLLSKGIPTAMSILNS